MLGLLFLHFLKPRAYKSHCGFKTTYNVKPIFRYLKQSSYFRGSNNKKRHCYSQFNTLLNFTFTKASESTERIFMVQSDNYRIPFRWSKAWTMEPGCSDIRATNNCSTSMRLSSCGTRMKHAETAVVLSFLHNALNCQQFVGAIYLTYA